MCHEFAGRSINVHHIKQEADGGQNTLENAIVLCLRCHAEAGHFNLKHPLGTKYSPSELIRHRNVWYEACANGVAQFFSSIEAKVKRTYTSGELHKYVLLFKFHNSNKNVVSGWKLNVFMPYQFNVSTGEVEQHLEEVIDNQCYRKFQVTGSEKLFLSESIELTDPEWAKIEYDVNQAIYDSSREFETKIIWRFYSDSYPPITGELAWDEIQQF